jgi:hypothetical protein
VVLDSAARPLVVGERLGGHVELSGEVGDGGFGDLAALAGKPALELEEPEQHREPEAPRTAPGGDQLPVVVDEGPALDERFRLPLTPHFGPLRRSS